MQVNQQAGHLNLFQGVLVGAVWLTADAVFQQGAADWHSLRIPLVQEATGLALHAQAFEPVCAYRLRHRSQLSL